MTEQEKQEIEKYLSALCGEEKSVGTALNLEGKTLIEIKIGVSLVTRKNLKKRQLLDQVDEFSSEDPISTFKP